MMKIKPSQLELKEFVVLDFHYDFNPFEKELSIPDLFKEYSYDLDFAIRTTEQSLIQIFVKSGINYGHPELLPGYSLKMECMGIFSIDSPDDIKSEDEREALLVNSGLVMTISYLRTFLAGITGHFPLGKLLYPSIDLKDLMRQKKEKSMSSDVKSEQKRKTRKKKI